MDEPRDITTDDAATLLRWFKERGGIAIWASLDGEMSWIAPYKTASRRPAARPNGQSERKPERIITDPAEVILRDPNGHNITLAQWAAQQ